MRSRPASENESPAAKPSVVARWAAILGDEQCREGAVAVLRTLVNLGISIADIIPGAGEGASWGADIAKMARRVKLFSPIRALDLTPDVSLKAAVGSETAEFATGGFAPTHFVEAWMQYKADRPRMQAALARAKELHRAPDETAIRDATRSFPGAVSLHPRTNG